MKKLLLTLFTMVFAHAVAMAQVEQRLTNTDGTYSRVIRNSVNNQLVGKNQLVQVGNLGNALSFTGSPANQVLSMSSTGLTSSSGFIVSFWISSSSIANQTIFSFNQPSPGTTYLGIYTNNVGTLRLTIQNGALFGDGTYGLIGPVLTNNTKHHIVLYYNNSPGVKLFVDNIEYTTPYGGGAAYMQQTAGEIINFGYAQITTAYATNLIVDQVLFYNSLSSTDRTTLYNGGNGTGLVPTSGLIRQYDFEEGGTATTTVEKLGTGYDATLSNGLHWASNGLIPTAGASSEVSYFSVRDGIFNTERGIATWGDENGRNQQQGKWFQWYQAGKYPLVTDNGGHWLFNPANTSASLPTVMSTIDVAGNLTVGSGYAGTQAAPANGLLVEGNVGIGTASPAAKLQLQVSANNYTVNEGLRIVNNYGPTGNNNPGILLTNDGSSADPLSTTNQTWALSASVAGAANFGISYKGGSSTLITPFFIGGDGNVGIGTTDPRGFKLAVAGGAIAESMTVKLHANWPDYVFKNDHQLTPLSEVKNYIDQNKHLPEVPSEAEVAKDGINLGEMNKLLLKKVEELTLYLIEKDKQLKDQEAINKALDERLKAIEQKLIPTVK